MINSITPTNKKKKEKDSHEKKTTNCKVFHKTVALFVVRAWRELVCSFCCTN